MRPGEALFCVVSFEGPDDYARVGGLADHVTGLVGELAQRGFETHLVYFGDPRFLRVERVAEHLILHRWAQWLSRQCPAGVYQAEAARGNELAASLPGYLLENIIRPMTRARFTPIIIAAEWQTLPFLQALDQILWRAGLRAKVVLGWELAAPSLGKFDWAAVPEGVRLLSRDPAVVEAGIAAGRVVTPMAEGADGVLAALRAARDPVASRPTRLGPGPARTVVRDPASAGAVPRSPVDQSREVG